QNQGLNARRLAFRGLPEIDRLFTPLGRRLAGQAPFGEYSLRPFDIPDRDGDSATGPGPPEHQADADRFRRRSLPREAEVAVLAGFGFFSNLEIPVRHRVTKRRPPLGCAYPFLFEFQALAARERVGVAEVEQIRALQTAKVRLVLIEQDSH